MGIIRERKHRALSYNPDIATRIAHNILTRYLNEES